MSARATQSPLQMPDIRLQAQPYPPTLSISFLLSLEGSPYTATLGTHMATGRDVQLTRQIGEYLAAAELGRRGWIATTFTGSLPGFDILAVNSNGRTLEVQVKAIRSSSWQLNAGQFLNVDIKDGTQNVRGLKPLKSRGRICIFIVVREQGQDDFYVFNWKDLQNILREDYRDGRKRKNPDTLHFALYPKRIVHFKNNWAAIP